MLMAALVWVLFCAAWEALLPRPGISTPASRAPAPREGLAVSLRGSPTQMLTSTEDARRRQTSPCRIELARLQSMSA